MSDLQQDPRFIPHKFRPWPKNKFICTFCTQPERLHFSCGHSLRVIGCSTCSAPVFSAASLQRRREKNLLAMRERGVRPGGVRP
jgi:lysine/ornithine N-monooxygenase